MTKDQLQKDVYFLALRQSKVISSKFGDRRFTGMSSNSLVSIAYGVEELKSQILPGDAGDVQSCINVWTLLLPEHRKVGDALKAYKNALNCDWYGKEVNTFCKNCSSLIYKHENCKYCKQGEILSDESDYWFNQLKK